MAFLRSIIRSNNLVLHKFNNNCSDRSLNKNFLKLFINYNFDAVAAVAGNKQVICRFSSSAPQPKARINNDDQHNVRQDSPSPTAGGSERNWDPLDVGFSDPIAAFKSKTTFELCRAYLVYFLCSSEFLVDNNMKVIFLYFI